jgi:PAS domain S-box-containing protein
VQKGENGEQQVKGKATSETTSTLTAAADEGVTGGHRHPADPHLIGVERIIQVATEARDPGPLVRDTLTHLSALPQVAAAAYYAVDRRAGVARLEQGEGLPDAFRGAASQLEVAAAPYDNTLVHRQPVFLADFAAAVPSHAAAGNFASMACAPVIARDDVVGALCVYATQPHDWGPADQVVMPAVGLEMGAALSRLYAEHQLNERRLPIQDLFDSVGELLVVTAADGRLLWANAHARSRLGYTQEQITHMTMLDLHPLGRRLEAAAILADLLDGEEEFCAIPLLARDGSHVPVETRVRWGTWDGRRVIFGVSRDLGERLRLSEEREQMVGGALDIVGAVARTVDPDTAEHARRVARLCTSIARELGYAPDRIAGLNMAAALHDVGLTGVPQAVLGKRDKLTEDEYDLIKTHPTLGWELLRGAQTAWPLADVVLQHHERLDGSGYPNGLLAPEILPESRIVAVADVVEAMSSERPYREPHSLTDAMTEIVDGSGTRYDADVVAATVRLYEHGLDPRG